jgi:hypothetical protein
VGTERMAELRHYWILAGSNILDCGEVQQLAGGAGVRKRECHVRASYPRAIFLQLPQKNWVRKHKGTLLKMH